MDPNLGKGPVLPKSKEYSETVLHYSTGYSELCNNNGYSEHCIAQ